jgi:hypothetical protein
VVLTAQEGTITEVAPDSQPLPIFMTCEWRILGGEGQSAQVELILEEVHLDADCSFATLSIFDGPDTSSPQLVPESCGSGPAATRLSSTGNSVTVVLKVNEKSVANRGIRIGYKVIDVPKPNMTGESLLCAGS